MRTIPRKLIPSEKREYTGEYSSQSTKEFTTIPGTDCYWPPRKSGKYTHGGDRMLYDAYVKSEITVYAYHYSF